MSAPSIASIELTDEELQVVKNALHAYISGFGHDEAEILHAAQKVLGKIERVDPTRT
ncbi:MAG TPA: hypothetical protein VGN18_01655 [Jatrophihabitans sp.]|jgi:hypothetical protein|uniref:hypothetical protein n=1 Tax=Jatrophihabitans sp. TaxID=1932789 RepID=UPI002E05899E|nr:hypothetical protein [Jatrophihabitans sp.]